MKNLFLLLILPFLTTISRAQVLLVPVQDTISGLYGYKKAGSRSWTIKPAFESAEWFFMGSAVVEKKGKFGLLSPAARFILPHKFDELRGDSLLTFKSEDSIGVCTRKGKIIFASHDTHIILDEEKGSAILIKDSLYGYWDTSGTYIQPFSRYELMFTNGIAYFQSGQSKGFINNKGEKIVEVDQGELIELDGQGFITVDDKQAFYTSQGKMLGVYDEILQVTDSIILFRNGNSFGIVTKTGRVLTSGDYVISPFNSKGFAVVEKDGKYGILNEMGEQVLPIEYASIEAFGKFNKRVQDAPDKEKEFVVIIKDKLSGVADDSGKIVIEPTYQWAKTEEEILWYAKDDSLKFLNIYSGKKVKPSEVLHFNLDRAIACMNSESACGLIDRGGKLFITPSNKVIRDLHNGYYIVFASTGAGVMDSIGKVIIPLSLKDIKILGDIQPNSNSTDFISDNFLYLIGKSGKVGFADARGGIFSDTSWENSSVFDEDGKGFFVKNKKGSWDMLSPSGKKYSLGLDTPSVFSEGYAVVKKKGKYGLISLNGKRIIAPKYENIVHQSNGLNYYKENGLWGLLSERGKVLSKPTFVHVTEFKGDMALVQSRASLKEGFNDVWGVIDTLGRFEPGMKKLYEIEASRTLNEGKKKIVPFGITYLKNFDEVSFELIADSSSQSSLENKVNNQILKEMSSKFTSMPDLSIPLLIENISKKQSASMYRGMGIEIRSITQNTASLGYFQESLINNKSEVNDTVKVYYYDQNALVRVNLHEIFSNGSWVSYLNEVIASKLRQQNFSIISSNGSLVFFDMNNFSITPAGLILKLNETALGMTNGYSDEEVLIRYEEIEEIVKKDGALNEFYR